MITKKIEQVFETFLDTQNLRGKKILVLVSGGVDSMVLLDIVAKNAQKVDIEVLHINHNTRESSLDDKKIVQQCCKKHDISFICKEIKKIPKKNKENFWRKERKEICNSVAKNKKCHLIITAHHATDLVETMIFRLTKGCGPKGLSPFDISTKPFWKVSKSEIQSYAKENKIEWNEDESNTNEEFSRNLIRKKVIPELRKITPNLEKVFIQESEIFGEISNFFDETTENMLEKILETPKEENATMLQKTPNALKKSMIKKIGGAKTSFSEVKDALKWIEKKPKGNSFKKIGNTVLRFFRGKFFMERKDSKKS